MARVPETSWQSLHSSHDPATSSQGLWPWKCCGRRYPGLSCSEIPSPASLTGTYLVPAFQQRVFVTGRGCSFHLHGGRLVPLSLGELGYGWSPVCFLSLLQPRWAEPHLTPPAWASAAGCSLLASASSHHPDGALQCNPPWEQAGCRQPGQQASEPAANGFPHCLCGLPTSQGPRKVMGRECLC